MAHELETLDDGQTAFVANRTPGWHGLGQVFTGTDRLDLGKALDLGRLSGWDVRLAPVFALDGYDPILAEQYRMTIRNNPADPDAPAQPLGMVSPDYVPVQNEQAFGFGENLVDAGCEVEALGSLKGGKQTFCLFRLPRTIEIGGDVVLPYLHLATSHDGSMAVTAKGTGIRVVCANTQDASLRDGNATYRALHIGDGLDGKVQDARTALGIVMGGFDEFEKDMAAMIARDVTAAQFDAIMAASFPEPEDEEHPATKTRRLQSLEDVRFIYETSPTNATIHGTAWGVAQALTEWNDWYRGTTQGEARARAQVGRIGEANRRQAFATVERVLIGK